MDQLRQMFAWEVLRAIQKGDLSVGEVCRRMDRDGTRAVWELQRGIEERAHQTVAAEPAASIPEVPTLGAEFDDFLAAYKEDKEKHSYSTVSSRIRGWKEHVRADGMALRDVPLDEVMSEDVRSFLARFSSPSTREGYRLALSAAYTWSIAREEERAEVQKWSPRWSGNPAARVKAVRKSKRVRIPTEDEVHALLAVAEPYQEGYLRPIVHVGLRIGELIHSRLGIDLDLDQWIWKIQAHRKDPRCNCLQCRIDEGESEEDDGWTPKNANGYRTLHVPVRPAGLRRSIVALLELYPAGPGDYVFRNPRTRRIWVARSLETDFAGLCARAGVPYGRDVEDGLVLHDLRHVCATNLVRRGVRESKIAAILGDSVKTVVETYINLTPHDLGEGVSQGPAYDLEDEDAA